MRRGAGVRVAARRRPGGAGGGPDGHAADGGPLTIELRPLTHADAPAHCAGEDDETVRWLTGGYGTVEGTCAYFDVLAANAAAGSGKRGFGVWLDGRLAGYVDLEPDLGDGLDPGDVNLTYAVHPWARGRGVAVEAVRLVCEVLRTTAVGTRAALRIEPGNAASLRVADRAGFVLLREVVSATDTHPDGTPVTFRVFARDL
ncbi:MAG: GNAT family N-acetyltransferase [Actinobacteria bacterium]|nr:GNAT family N-acetyltransferase [Actinomycetota bacterium]